jgi:hypothetical protein
MKIDLQVMPWHGHHQKNETGKKTLPGFQVIENPLPIVIETVINYSYSFKMFLTSSGATLP